MVLLLQCYIRDDVLDMWNTLENPEDFYTKDCVVVQTRPKCALGAGHMTQPFYSISDIIDTLIN